MLPGGHRQPNSTSQLGMTTFALRVSTVCTAYACRRDVLARYHPLALRWFLVSSQYRAPLNYSDKGLEVSAALLATNLSHAVGVVHGRGTRRPTNQPIQIPRL